MHNCTVQSHFPTSLKFVDSMPVLSVGAIHNVKNSKGLLGCWRALVQRLQCFMLKPGWYSEQDHNMKHHFSTSFTDYCSRANPLSPVLLPPDLLSISTNTSIIVFGHTTSLHNETPAHKVHRVPSWPWWIHKDDMPPADLWKNAVGQGHCGVTLQLLNATRW